MLVHTPYSTACQWPKEFVILESEMARFNHGCGAYHRYRYAVPNGVLRINQVPIFRGNQLIGWIFFPGALFIAEFRMCFMAKGENSLPVTVLSEVSTRGKTRSDYDVL